MILKTYGNGLLPMIGIITIKQYRDALDSDFINQHVSHLKYMVCF